MFRPSSAACQDVSSFVRHPVFSESVCVLVRERESFIQEREKPWCGSCAVWMFRPSSAACQDVSSFVKHPMFSEYVSVLVRERDTERESFIQERKKLWLVLSGCFVYCQQPVKMFRLSSGTPCLVSVYVYVYLEKREREREKICTCKRERHRERALYKRDKSFGVGLVLSGCLVHRQQPIKMFRLSLGTPCYTISVWRVCVCLCIT